MATRPQRPSGAPVDPAISCVLQGLVQVLAGVLQLTAKGRGVYEARPREVAELNRSAARCKTAAILADAALSGSYQPENMGRAG